MMAAIAAADNSDVTVIERNRKLGMKLNITGKGRCNLTNNCDVRTLTENVPTNPKFLYKAFTAFTPADITDFFESNGLPLKTERGRRVFPQSDSAFDVNDTLRRVMAEKGVHIVQGKATELIIENGVCKGVVTDRKKTYLADSTIVATGGASYPKTGSDGSGYRLCEKAGHTIMPLSPSLVPLTSSDKCCTELMGLSLKNVSVSFYRGEKELYHDFGEMLFTHFGVSGPMILSASADLEEKELPRLVIHLDFKPALDEKTLNARILSDFSENANRDFQNSLGALLPRALIGPVIARCGIPPHQKVHQITKEKRRALCRVIKDFTLHPTKFRPIDEAIVTRGGVDTRELDPRTMASRLCSGLYFAGEMIDVDAYTGGYNLQICFACANAAGKAAALIP